MFHEPPRPGVRFGRSAQFFVSVVLACGHVLAGYSLSVVTPVISFSVSLDHVVPQDLLCSARVRSFFFGALTHTLVVQRSVATCLLSVLGA